MSEQDSRVRAFVQWLQDHHQDRGLMAELRRGLTRDTEWRAWPHLTQWCDLTRPDERVAFAAVAGAFATHPEATHTGNLGDTMREIATGGAGKKSDRQAGLRSFEGRFRRLLTCESVEELAERVGAVVRAAKQKGVPICYLQLLRDLRRFRWPDSREQAKVHWAASFWRATGQADQDMEDD